MERYTHTQIGYGVAGPAAGVGVVSCVGLAVYLGNMPGMAAVRMPLIAMIAAFSTFALACFSTLTVSIDEESLRVRFGPVPLFRKNFPLWEIESAEPVTSPWYYGYGIRLTPYGWLYNVGGPHSVEITLTDGKRYRIGTDEPTRLAEAIRQSIRPGGVDSD